MKKENNTPPLYSKKSKIKIIICALLVLALTVVGIIIIAKGKTEADDFSVETEKSTDETASSPAAESEDKPRSDYVPVDTAVVTDAPDNAEPVTPDVSDETALVPADNGNGGNTAADTDAVTDAQTETAPQNDRGYLGKGLYVTSPEPYSGVYVEDGSDEEVSDILSVTLKNSGSEVIRYISFKVYYGETVAAFEATTVLPNTSVVVLEKNRLTFPDRDFDTCEAGDIAYFDEDPIFYSDYLKVSGAKGQIIISNTGENDIAGNVAVYYKTVKDGKYFGGITYRATSQSVVKSNDSVILPARHFSPDTCRVMFVTYE